MEGKLTLIKSCFKGKTSIWKSLDIQRVIESAFLSYIFEGRKTSEVLT